MDPFSVVSNEALIPQNSLSNPSSFVGQHSES